MRILIVEDEEDIAEVIRRGLEAIGVVSVLASDAESADRLLGDIRVDGLTVDLGMPDRDGLDWLESLAGRRPELARRAVVITGRPLDPLAIRRLARCGAGVLGKPFTLAGLHETVRSQIGFGIARLPSD